MRNPNGFGSVVYLGKSRRRPYAIRKTIKFVLQDDSCIQKYKYFGYFSTKQEAIIALSKLNERRLDASASDYTFGDMFDEWFTRHTRKLEPASARKLSSAYNKYCKSLSGASILSVTEAMLQSIIDDCEMAYQTQVTIKQVLQGVMSYTQSRGLRADDPSAMLTAGGSKSVRPHKVFSMRARSEMRKDPEAWTVYFLLYSGMRIEELLRVKLSDVNLSEGYLVGGMKSDAGKQRIVPLHRFLIPLVQSRSNQQYLIELDGKRLSYKNYRSQIWDKIMLKYGYDYTPHDTRHTFVTNMNKAGVPELYIQKIVGHVPKSVTQRVYTHVDPADLIREINRLD